MSEGKSFLEHLEALWAEEVRRFEGTNPSIYIAPVSLLRFEMDRGAIRHRCKLPLALVMTVSNPAKLMRDAMKAELERKPEPAVVAKVSSPKVTNVTTAEVEPMWNAAVEQAEALAQAKPDAGDAPSPLPYLPLRMTDGKIRINAYLSHELARLRRG